MHHFDPTPILLSGGVSLDLDATLFIQAGIFLVAFLMMRNLVFRPMLRVIDARQAASGGQQTEAEHISNEVRAKYDELTKRIERTRTAAAQERDALVQEGNALERDVLEKTRRETQALLAEATENIDRERRRVRSELRAAVPGLSKQIASQLAGRDLG